jgi:GAF domain-containing protein
MTPDYELLEKQLAALMDGESDALAMSANFVALLYAEIPDINWLGIYVCRNEELVLGPFQGLPACVHIPLGRGVCGTAAATNETQRVDDVHAFDGHIACDPASKSELVVPLAVEGQVFAVLDIDSPSANRFSSSDQVGIEKLCDIFVATLVNLDKAGPAFI